MYRHKLLHKILILIISITAIGFGVLTIKSGGDVLFWSHQAREAAGNYVPFVLWFNFISGFVYVISGISLMMKRSWAPQLALLITIAIIFVFILFSLHIINGGIYEERTLYAMSVRVIVWSAITALAYWLYRVGHSASGS